MSPTRAPKANNWLLSALPSDVLNRIWGELQPVGWSIREILYGVGDTINHVYFIESGIASIITLMNDGSTIEVGMIGVEGVVGVSAFLGAKTAAQNVLVQIPGGALRMSATACGVAFEQYPRFHALVLRFIDTFLNLSAQTAACNRLHSATQRCARWLLMAADRTQSDTMPMTHEFLASMVGVRRTGVTAIARDLSHQGLIHYRHGLITIRDRTGLEAVACECHRVDRERLAALY